MGYFEATTIVHVPAAYDKQQLTRALEQKATIQLSAAGVIEIMDWYRLPEDPTVAILFSDPEDPQIYLSTTYPNFLEIVTMAELFNAPVRSTTSDTAFLQYAELVSLVGSEVGADCAWLAPHLQN